MSRRRMAFALITAAVAGGAVILAQNGIPLNPNSENALTVAVYGDSPYGLNPTDTSETDKTLAFIASINADPKVDLVLHVGDIHSGKQYCTEAYDRLIADLWTTFKNPVIYTQATTSGPTAISRVRAAMYTLTVIQWTTQTATRLRI
jgi:hypothetical protein